MKTSLKSTEAKVLKTFQTANPSVYPIEKSQPEFSANQRLMKELFGYRLHFPEKMFKDSTLLEFGPGTGERSVFFLRWGARCTFVENNPLAITRAREIFRRFAPGSDWTIKNTSLFNYHDPNLFDITVSTGVIHHTADLKRAFLIQAKYTKPGGFTILGIGNTAGAFQRNLQRLILYRLANSEDEIVSLAPRLFPQHLDRATKIGRRPLKTVIYDSYVNPKAANVSMSNILSWLKPTRFRLYSSWPPITPSFLGDSEQNRLPDYHRFLHLIGLTELVWLNHNHSDADVVYQVNRRLKHYTQLVEEFAQVIGDITPNSTPNLSRLAQIITLVKKITPPDNPYVHYIRNFTRLIAEVEEIVACLRRSPLPRRRLIDVVKSTKYLFRGSCGLGNVYIVARKKIP